MRKAQEYYVDSQGGREISTVNLSDGGYADNFAFNKRWYLVLWIAVLLMICILAMRVFSLTILDHYNYALGASDNTTREEVLRSVRGKIYDRSGVLLADNESNQSLVVRYHQLDAFEGLSQQERDKVISEISLLFDVSVDDITSVYNLVKERREDGIVAQRISRDQVIYYRASGLSHPVFEIVKSAARVYPRGPLFAHVIGYEGLINVDELEQKRNDFLGEGGGYMLTDRIGKRGLELVYEDVLHGRHGVKTILVNNVEQEIRTTDVMQPEHGADLLTHIDSALQEKMTQEMERALQTAGSVRGAAVALDPRNGGVLGLVSLPLYDNNAFVHGIEGALYNSWVSDKDKPLFNRAVSGTYPPGSTIKPMMGIATLAENIVDPATQIESRGGIRIGKSFFGDWKAHGFTDLRRAIAVSSDVYFYTVGGGYGGVRGLGIERMSHWMRVFGYGQETGIDLTQEASGIYPDADIKQDLVGERWYTGDTFNTSIGQGFFTATPLQIANATAAIANGGTLYQPHIASKIIYPDNTEKEIPSVVLKGDIANARDLQIVQEGMRMTVTEGTARMMQSVPVAVAGKTGTAQFFGDDEKVHSWFSAYAPFESPEIVLLILVEGQDGSISSSTVPVAKEILSWYFRNDR